MDTQAQYVDGFLIPIPKDKVEAYRDMANIACRVWLEHGALEYRECVGDDLAAKDMVPFPQAAQAKEDETVVFAWITYRSREHRDEVNAKVMQDPRMTEMMTQGPQIFDCARMSYGGFKVIVSN